MDLHDLLAIYDRDQRQNVVYGDTRREELPNIVRHIETEGDDGMVIYSTLTPDNADQTIREQIAFFASIGHSFEWKLYAHDQPPDLGTRLAAFGLQPEEAEAIMVMALDDLPTVLTAPVTLDIRRITTPEQVRTMMAVQDEVWGADHLWLIERLIQALSKRPDSMSIYAAYADEVPVSSAWTAFPEDSLFASLWGGSTRSAYRGRGYYTALLAVRAQEARVRGRRFLTVDASPMSRPILEKHGFQQISTAYPYKWDPDG
jgi:GNAT superfamily N-acetyltransferase